MNAVEKKLHPNSLANLNPQARYQRKVSLHISVLPETARWLKEQGNASAAVDQIVAVAQTGDVDRGLLREIKILRCKMQVLKNRVHRLQVALFKLKQCIQLKEAGFVSNSFAKGLTELREIFNLTTIILEVENANDAKSDFSN